MTCSSALKRVLPTSHARHRIIVAVALAAPFLAARGAHAHVSITSGPAAANTTQEIIFGVGHGCAGADTSRVRVELPAGVTSVRPETSDFGKTSVEKDATGAVTA